MIDYFHSYNHIMSKSVTLEEVRALEEPTKDYLCRPEDNIYDI